MNSLIKIIIVLCLIFTHYTATTYAVDTNLNTGGNYKENSTVNNNTYLEDLENVDTDFGVSKGGQEGIYNSIIRIARDLKNLFFLVSGLFFIILVIKLLMTEKTEEEITNFKKGIIWMSVGIVITQISYYFVNVLFDKDVGLSLAEDFIATILQPLIKVLETATSFIFLAIMIFAFFRIITANGDEEKAKSGKMSVLYALVGFIIVKLSTAIVTTVYGKSNCRGSIFQTNCVNQTDLVGFANIVVKVIDWMNSFLGIIVILMIIYAGFLVITSVGDEEKLKKAKSIILYIIVGIFILIFNYLILTFFLIPESTI